MFETWHIVTGTAVLNDATFLAYGGHTGTATVAQRNAAYAMAEQFAVLEIGTFLTPTTVTGTFVWPIQGNYPVSDFRFQLPHQRVRSVGSVTAIHDAGCDCAEDAIEISGCAWILDGDNGVVDLRECGNTVQAGCSNCSCGPGDPSITSFSDTGYSETRGFLRFTQFGGSARANYAARMFEPFKFKGAL